MCTKATIFELRTTALPFHYLVPSLKREFNQNCLDVHSIILYFTSADHARTVLLDQYNVCEKPQLNVKRKFHQFSSLSMPLLSGF
jgi:hypothetical protein